MDPPGPDTAPLQQQLLHVRVVVELEYDGALGVLVHARFGEYSALLPPCFVAEGVEPVSVYGQHGVGPLSCGTLWVVQQPEENFAALLLGSFGRELGGNAPSKGRYMSRPLGCSHDTRQGVPSGRLTISPVGFSPLVASRAFCCFCLVCRFEKADIPAVGGSACNDAGVHLRGSTAEIWDVS